MAQTLSPGFEREVIGEGWVYLIEGFVAEDVAWMNSLLETLPLRQESIRVAGRAVLTPRLTSWHGDPRAAYSYSGRRFDPLPFGERLNDLRMRVNQVAETAFNSVLVNYYRDGSDSMGAHADDEPELGPSRDDIRIASLSLGAKRRFVLRARSGGPTHEWWLGEGSLFVMGGRLQRTHLHSVPKTTRVVRPRMNLTFRVIRVPFA